MHSSFFRKGRLDAYAEGTAFGIYIHVPFCVRRCRYCAFFSTTLRRIPDAFVRGLLNEAELRRGPFDGRVLKSLYLGGGTPSRLDDASLAQLIDGMRTRFGDAREVTLECNPEHVSAERAVFWKSLGVTRVSLGIQSFDGKMLRFLGRAHSADDASRAVETIIAAGIDEVSIDLIYGGKLECDPRDPLECWAESLSQAKQTGAKHVSCYALTIEPHTPLATLQARGIQVVHDDELVLQMMRMIPEGLSMRQYEISNYAAEDYFSAHNVSCWAGEPYLGLGPGAHSMWFEDATCVRRADLGNVDKYLECVCAAVPRDPPVEFVERLSPQMHLAECLICAARTRFAWDPQKIAQRLDADLAPYRRPLQKAVSRGLLQVTRSGDENAVFRATALGVQLNNCLDALIFEGAPDAF